MPNNHSLLSPSSSHRWLECTPSARLEENFPDAETEAAAEGTAAHALCEHKLRKMLKMRSKKPHSEYDCDEMDEYTDGYVQFVMGKYEEAKQFCKDPIVLVEQRLDFSKYVPDGFGTGDCLIIADNTLNIIDFKYGQGILVDAERNPQMMMYALGALLLFDGIYDITSVCMTIYQPRRYSISSWTVPACELKDWAENELAPKAQMAYNGEGSFCPGEWCTFCRAAVKCRARADQQMELAKFEFAAPPLLSNDELSEILGKLDGMIKWANDIKAYCEDAALNHGVQWKGFKVVEGRSIRKYTDEDAVAQAAKAHGYTDIYKKSLISITEMEKLMGKREFNEILGNYVHKPAGKPTLVPESDKRPAIGVSAAEDFSNFEEDNNNG